MSVRQRPVALLALLFLLLGGAEGCATARRPTVALTVDDLPGPPAGLVSNAPQAVLENTRRLLAVLRAERVPAVGFVNEGKLDVDGESAAERGLRVAALRAWLDGGFELGNHTYSHRSLSRTPLAEFEADVLRGEPETRRLLAERRRPLRYFRHPFLHVGRDLDTRVAFEAFLRQHGYTVAPVTVDSDEYVFAAVYAAALRRGDRDFAARVADAYLGYMAGVVAFIEEVTLRLLGRPIPQILLLHANTLNADRVGDLIALLRRRGYGFVSLATALGDPVYRSADTYVGGNGISWLHHWELTAGKPRSPSPDPPEWVQVAYDALP